MPQKIIPHLWFDTQAVEAAEFYTTVFGGDSQVTHKSVIKDTPSGDCDIVGFSIWGYEFMAISAGPLFQFNPSISMMINFDPSQDEHAETRIDEIWNQLVEGGKALMPLDEYPFSKRYGWVQDKYGFSWQLILTNPEGEERPAIIPSLLYVTDSCTAAEEATGLYLSVFQNAPSAAEQESKRGAMSRYPAGMEPNKEGSIMFTDFQLAGQWFIAMDGSSQMHEFKFNEAVSLMVNCRNQEEIDYFWEKLSAVPDAEQCGWIKDAYGVSWQIVPAHMNELMSQNMEKTTPVMLNMKKIIIADLEKAAQE